LLLAKEGLALQWRDRTGIAPASSFHARGQFHGMRIMIGCQYRVRGRFEMDFPDFMNRERLTK
jgi:hypothetical protein